MRKCNAFLTIEEKEPEIKKYRYFFQACVFIPLIVFDFIGCKKNIDNNIVNYSYESFKTIPIIEENEKCPEFELRFADGHTESIVDHIGNIIVLRFTRFNPFDVSSLRYLDFLNAKIEKYGFKQYFIYTLGKSNSKVPYEKYNFSTPIIEDDGYISALVKARINDFVLIDKNFNVIIRHNELSDQAIYSIVRKAMQGSPEAFLNSHIEILDKNIKSLCFIDISTGKVEQIGNLINKSKAMLIFSIAPCLSCPLKKRLAILSEIAKEHSTTQSIQFVYLFENKNKEEEIREWQNKVQLPPFWKVGIIKNNENSPQMSLGYNIFKLHSDPFLLIYNEFGKIVFQEDKQEDSKIPIEKLIGFLK